MSRENNCLDQYIEAVFLAAGTLCDSIKFYHFMSSENVSSKMRSKSLFLSLASAILIKGINASLKWLTERSFVLEVLTLTSHSLSQLKAAWEFLRSAANLILLNRLDLTIISVYGVETSTLFGIYIWEVIWT